MNDFPLNTFLTSLAADGITLAARDYKRLLLTLQTGGTWTVARLKNVLTVLLAKDRDQQRLIAQKFDKFFAPETATDSHWSDIDIQRILDDLRAMEPAQIAPTLPGMPEAAPKDVDTAIPAVSEKPRKPYLRQILAGSLLVAVLALIVIGVLLMHKPSDPIAPTEPVLELSHRTLNFGTQSLDGSYHEEIALTNASAVSLTIESLVIENQAGTAFGLSLPALNDLPKTIPPNQSTIALVVFTPEYEQSYAATLEITHNGASRVDTVSLTGTGKGIPTAMHRRLYRDVPTVEDITPLPVETSTAWQTPAAISSIVLLITGLYGLYLRRLMKGPQDKAPDWDAAGPRFFHPGVIGGQIAPRLGENTLNELADSMGYFKSAQPGRVLNVPGSIKATVRQGGIPIPQFYKRTRLRTLLILEDEYAEARTWNPMARELAEGMARYGVPILYGQFRGTPTHFRTPEGAVYHLEDLEDQRRGILLLLFTDGKVFHRPQNAFALEAIARWPMLAWMELRERRFWDETLHLPAKNKIPVYPATREGLVQALRRFLTERGASESAAPELTQDAPLTYQTGTQLDAELEYGLGDALLWAQDCALIQPITEGLADALRVKFHPQVSPAQIERLYALPNTTRTDAGLRFSDAVLKTLRQGFLNRRTEAERQAVLDFVFERVEAAKPDVPENSLAYLSWEAVRERVRLELGAEGDEDLQRFGELMQSPLAKTMSDSLANYGFADQPEKIPLLNKPKSKVALRRLQRVVGNPLGIDSLLSWVHKAILGLLVLSCLISVGWTIKALIEGTRAMPNLEIVGLDTALARLERWDDGVWTIVKGPVEARALSDLRIEEGPNHRLTLYGNGYRTVATIVANAGQKTQILLAEKDQERDCIEAYTEIGLFVESCPPEVLALEDVEVLRFLTWKERLGDKAPDGRVMSIGVEVSDRDTSLLGVGYFGNRLLETGSVDVLYQIHPDDEGKWHFAEALATLRADITPWIPDSQVIWWEVGQVEDLPDDAFADFARILEVSTEGDMFWATKLQRLFEPGDDILVSEKEILAALGHGKPVGPGTSLALIRPLKTQYALTVRTTPHNAIVRILNIREQYYDGILLEPGPYEIEVSREGYETYREEITLKDEEQTIEVTLIEIPIGWLTVSADPDFASIRVARADGSESITVDRDARVVLPVGAWRVTATAAGYAPAEESVEIVEGQESSIALNLDMISTEFSAIELSTLSFDSRVGEVVFSPANTYFAIKTDTEVLIYDSEFQEVWQNDINNTILLETIAFSSDERHFAFLASKDEYLISILQLENEEITQLQTLAGHSDEINTVAFSPDGQYLASGSADDTVKIWHLTSRQFSELQTLTGHSDDIWSVAFSPDGQYLASGSADDTIKIWPLVSGQFPELQTLTGYPYITNVVISPDGQYLASGSQTTPPNIWHLASGQFSELQALTGDSTGVWSMAFSPDGQYLASGGYDRTVKIWHLASGQFSELQTLTGHSDWVRSVAFSPDGQYLASGGDDRTVIIWQLTGIGGQ